MKNIVTKILLLAVGFGIGYGAFAMSGREASDTLSEVKSVREQGDFKFTSPLLDIESELPNELKPFKSRIGDLVGQKIETGQADFISVYFRDLNNGPWFGIEERHEYLPASLLKVPLMMNYYKIAETNPAILSQQIEYVKRINNIHQVFTPSLSAEVGRAYTVEELIELMVVYSDNNALALLVENLDNQGLSRSDIFKALDVDFDLRADSKISVKNYGTFLRILYNSSYLNPKYSEKALETLSRTEFDGIRSGVPDSISVAEKFGERTTEEGDSLHACGIVYHPSHPYVLCLMTLGDDFPKLKSTITDISQAVYKEVDSQR